MRTAIRPKHPVPKGLVRSENAVTVRERGVG